MKNIKKSELKNIIKEVLTEEESYDVFIKLFGQTYDDFLKVQTGIKEIGKAMIKYKLNVGKNKRMFKAMSSYSSALGDALERINENFNMEEE